MVGDKKMQSFSNSHISFITSPCIPVNFNSEKVEEINKLANIKFLLA